MLLHLHVIGGLDFTPVWANLTFSNTMTVQNIRIWITDDGEAEEEEYFQIVVISSDSRCVAGRPASITIAENMGELHRI